MSFRSPWQRAFFRNSIAVARRMLRPFGKLENRLVEALARHQNRRVINHLAKYPPKDLLLIMPRCVKKSGCRADVQTGLAECLACGECALGDVAALCDRFGVKALVAFRSHIAFEMARTSQPDLIIATACHDRLIKALRTVPEFPALLAPLPPMEKMCVNAGVDIPWLEKHLALACGQLPHSLKIQPAGKTRPLPKARAAQGP